MSDTIIQSKHLWTSGNVGNYFKVFKFWYIVETARKRFISFYLSFFPINKTNGFTIKLTNIYADLVHERHKKPNSAVIFKILLLPLS